MSTNLYAAQITPDEAEELYRIAEPGHHAGNWEFLAKQHIQRTSHWEEANWLVVRSTQTGRVYGLEYRESLSAIQDPTYPWDGATEPLALMRLYSHEIVYVEYRTKES